MAKKTTKAQVKGAETTKPEDQTNDQTGTQSTDDQTQTPPNGAGKNDQTQTQGDAQTQTGGEVEPLLDAIMRLDAVGAQSFEDNAIEAAGEVWAQAACDDFTPRLALAMFDTALDQGAEIAKRLLQLSVGVTADRDIGAKTHAAIADLPEGEVIERLLAYRLRRAAFAGNAHTDMMPRARRVIKTIGAILAMDVDGATDHGAV